MYYIWERVCKRFIDINAFPDACIQQWWNNEFSWQCRKRVDKSDTNDLSARVMHSEAMMAKWGQEWRSVNRRIWNLSMFAICLVENHEIILRT